MKTRIKKLIDEHVIQPLANALLTRITPAIEGGLRTMQDDLDLIKEKLDNLADEVRASKERAAAVDARFDKLQKSIDEHPNAGSDSRLAAIAAEIESIRGDVAGIAPAPAAATQAAADDSGSGSASSDTQP
jgi:DNA anti-recombination protein RmuC